MDNFNLAITFSPNYFYYNVFFIRFKEHFGLNLLFFIFNCPLFVEFLTFT